MSPPRRALHLVPPLWHCWAMSCWSPCPLFLHRWHRPLGCEVIGAAQGCAVGVGFVCFGLFLVFFTFFPGRV